MSILNNKKLIILPFIVLVVMFIFSLILIPSINPAPQNLPIAIVNQDEGLSQPPMDMGKMIVDNIKMMSNTSGDEEPAVKWIEVENYESVLAGLNNQEYYAALVIPKDYSAKQASLMTPNPTAPEIEIIINQGMNIMAANVAEKMLNGIIDNINAGIRTQLNASFEKQGNTLSIEQANLLVQPITKKVTIVNEVGTNSANGNAPVVLFQPLWVACMAGAAFLFAMRKGYIYSNRTDKFITLLIELFVGAILALVVGFGLTLVANNVLGLKIPLFTDTALFLTIAYFSFFLMILATMSWLGLKAGLAIYVVIMFFGAPLLAMPPEFMSYFYRVFVYSWIPVHFMIEGLRELFFFDQGLSLNHSTMVIIGIGLVSLLLLVASVFKPSKKTSRIRGN